MSAIGRSNAATGAVFWSSPSYVVHVGEMAANWCYSWDLVRTSSMPSQRMPPVMVFADIYVYRIGINVRFTCRVIAPIMVFVSTFSVLVSPKQRSTCSSWASIVRFSPISIQKTAFWPSRHASIKKHLDRI